MKTKRKLIAISVIIIICITVLVFLLSLLLNGINGWYMTHTMVVRSPVIIQKPVVIENRAEILTPIATNEAKFEKDVDVVEGYIRSREYGYILWSIYGLESTYGKNDPCKREGLHNGFGFDPGTCYGGIDEVTNLVNDWFEKRLVGEGLSVGEAVCYYNTGTIKSDCPYYQSYLKLTL